MLKKRIIPCLDIQNGRTVKGVNFESIRDAGDPIALAKRYMHEGADELVFLDISATIENRKTLTSLITQIASEISIPFTVGGGINSLDDAKRIVGAGADKITINSAAILQPKLISEIANSFGSQCVIVAVDTKWVNNEWRVFRSGGKIATDLTAFEWAKMATSLGAGELLLTSMNNDGTRDGFALEITERISEAVSVPVIASGGAGIKQHFLDVFSQTKASGALAASVFHFEQIRIQELKNYLHNHQIPVRL